MANVVEVVLKGVDLTGPPFARAIQTFGNVGKAAKGMLAVFAVGALVGGIGAVTNAMADNTLEAIKNADELARLSHQAAMAVQDFSQFSVAAGLAEVSTQELVAASKKLSEEMVSQGRGSESALGEMLKLSDQFASMETSAAKTALAVDKFGKAGQKLIPFLSQGSEAIREQMEEADKFGLTVGAKFAENADAFLDNIDRMKNAMRGLWMQVAQDVLPTLVELSEKTLQWIKHGDNLEKVAHKIGFAFNFMLRAGEELASLKTIAAGVLAPFITSAAIISKAWTQAQADMQQAREEMQKNADKEAPPEIIDEKELEKALRMQEQWQLSRERGAEAVREKERLTFEEQIHNIEKLGILEDDKKELRKHAEMAYQDELTRLKEQGELARAELDAHFRAGNVERYIMALRTMEGAELASLETRRNVMTAYHELWVNSLNNVKNAFINFSVSVIQSFSEGFGNAIASIATGAQTAEEAFASLGKQMLGMLAKFIAQLIINTILAEALQATISASTLAAITPIAGAWAAAATAAAIATFGGATAAGALVPPLMAANAAAGSAIAIGAGALHGGLDFVPAETTFLLQRGERVVSPAQNQDLTEFLERQSGGPMVINLYMDSGEPLATWLYNGTRNGKVQIHPRGVRE